MTTKYNVIFKELSDKSFDAFSERVPSIICEQIEIPPQAIGNAHISKPTYVAGNYTWEPLSLKFENSDELATLIQAQVQKQYDVLYKTLADKDKLIINSQRYKFDCALVNDDLIINISDTFIQECNFNNGDDYIEIVLIFNHAIIRKAPI